MGRTEDVSIGISTRTPTMQTQEAKKVETEDTIEIIEAK